MTLKNSSIFGLKSENSQNANAHQCYLRSWIILSNFLKSNSQGIWSKFLYYDSHFQISNWIIQKFSRLMQSIMWFLSNHENINSNAFTTSKIRKWLLKQLFSMLKGMMKFLGRENGQKHQGIVHLFIKEFEISNLIW